MGIYLNNDIPVDSNGKVIDSKHPLYAKFIKA